MRIVNVLFSAAVMILLSVACINAQNNKNAVADIVEIRLKVIEAIKKQDRPMLDRIFAEGYTHTHATGKVDDKNARLDVLVSGERTIDTAPAEDLKIRMFGKGAAVASGRSAVSSDDGIVQEYRWTIVYVRVGNNWRVAASHATKIAQ